AARALIVLLLAALLTPLAGAQTPNVRLSGVVRDSAGVAREGVTVRATSPSGFMRSGITRADGAYTITDLTPGTYTVTASLIGNRRATQANVQLRANQTMDFVLAPVALQTVTVTATLREQELTDVPFSVAAPTAADLRSRGAENIEQIAANVAGFSVQ